MSMKIVLVAAASVLTVSPALAMSRSQIVHHTGGPIPYSQLTSLDRSGYNARSHHRHSTSKTVGETSVAANTSTSAAPGATPSPDQTAPSGAVNTPTPAPAAPAASATTSAPSTEPNAAPPPAALPPATTPAPANPAAPSSAPAPAPASAAPH